MTKLPVNASQENKTDTFKAKEKNRSDLFLGAVNWVKPHAQ